MHSQVHSEPGQGRTEGRGRPRWRRRGVLATGTALLLLLIGHGLGWFGSAPQQKPQPEPQPKPQREGRPDVGRTGSMDLASTIGAPPAVADAGLARDRFSSLLSLVQSHLVAGSFEQARRAASRLAARELSERQRERLAALVAAIDDGFRAAEAEVLAHVQNGDLLAAERAAAKLWPEGGSVGEVIAAGASGLGLPRDWSATPATEPVPAPLPLGRGRAVRVVYRDRIVAGQVAREADGQVTVQVRLPRGQSFPTVPRVCCEPSESSAAEAVEMGLAALGAGQPRLARLWLLRAWLTSGRALGDRGRQLLRMLR
ncbi:MAG TPA: hypothetical protein ENI87_07070 [bacterium]|nr:hypothetical protein [bacterium]